MSTEERKNTKKFLFFNSLIASKPMIDAIDGFSLLSSFTGGVFGNKKLNTPNNNDAIDAIRKVFFNKPSSIPWVLSHLNKYEMESPAMIHPIVPKIRM